MNQDIVVTQEAAQIKSSNSDFISSERVKFRDTANLDLKTNWSFSISTKFMISTTSQILWGQELPVQKIPRSLDQAGRVQTSQNSQTRELAQTDSKRAFANSWIELQPKASKASAECRSYYRRILPLKFQDIKTKYQMPLAFGSVWSVKR